MFPRFLRDQLYVNVDPSLYCARQQCQAVNESLFGKLSETIDFAVVLSGEIDMVLDDTSVHLEPGDAVVQQETNHAWVNHGSEPCRIAFVQIEATEP